jgi:hypothetical protein
MSSAAWCLNTAWMLKCGIEAAAFAGACRHVAETQALNLRKTLQANRDTAFGRQHGFSRIRNAHDYQDRVPQANYEDLDPWMRRITAGEAQVLTREPVRLLEPTSGTTGGEKLIPYTSGLRRQFQRGVAAWIFDLFRQRPALRGGRAYWSISPMLGPARRSPGGLPIGFEDDADYLGWIERFALRHLLVRPRAAARLPDRDRFRYSTLLSLLAADDLALISVWSPTFLTSLLEPLQRCQERLCLDLRHGSPVRHGPRPEPRRANDVGRILRSSAAWADRLRRIWPRLGLIRAVP